ncbi:unnamed protein product, partial [Arabidopsis halleri]
PTKERKKTPQITKHIFVIKEYYLFYRTRYKIYLIKETRYIFLWNAYF